MFSMGISLSLTELKIQSPHQYQLAIWQQMQHAMYVITQQNGPYWGHIIVSSKYYHICGPHIWCPAASHKLQVKLLCHHHTFNHWVQGGWLQGKAPQIWLKYYFTLDKNNIKLVHLFKVCRKMDPKHTNRTTLFHWFKVPPPTYLIIDN